MIRHKIFSGIEAYYTDPYTGDLVTNSRDEPATDRDIEQYYQAIDPELDRMALQMFADYRSRGEHLEQWQLDAEYEAFMRTRKRVAYA